MMQNLATNIATGGNPTPASKETADRLDMPPPPSPASSTCSDTSTSHSVYFELLQISFPKPFRLCFILFILERTRRMTVREEGSGGENKRDEEEWPLKDVIFLEDVKNVPLGNLLSIYTNTKVCLS